MTTSAQRQNIRKSLLFMPGDSLRKIEKATTLEVDSVIMDLEDGVAFSQKETARQVVHSALTTLNFGQRERLVRINPQTADPAFVDIESTILARPDGYVVPKVEDPYQLIAVDEYLSKIERDNHWPMLSVRLLGVIETALGVLNLREIAGATPRLDALMFGAEDLAGDIGATRTATGWEVFYARSAVVTMSAAYGLQAIDTVFIDLADLDGLEKECIFSQQMGYLGKMAIHPRQLETINRIYTPSPKQVAAAQRLISAFDENQAAGAGVFELDGKMVDMPMVRAAHRVLARAGR